MTRILLIEDAAPLRTELVEMLSFEGFEVMEAADGIAGLEALQHRHPDLIISDITMPRLDGYGLLLEVQANPATAHIPFIFMTARASHEDVRKGMIAGADDYITKPFTREEFLQAIKRRLAKKVAQEQEVQRGREEIHNALVQEREQRLLRSKMAAMFSHDFRNGLAAILALSSLLRLHSHRLTEERRLLHLGRIEDSAHLLLQMLDDMLVVAQMDNGKLEVTPVKLDTQAFFQKLVDDFRTQDGEQHAIVLENACDSPVLVDTRLLRQMADNLISNALKYSPAGGEVTIVVEECRDDNLRFTIRDQGIGIPQADQARMFEAFQRASNVGPITGTGLGLAIVKQAVDLHGGTIHMDSRPDQGTTFTVMLPAPRM